MDVASLELSKELFSLCADMWPDAPVQVGYVWGKTSKDNKVTLVRTSDMAGLYTWWFAFDLGFLLRKLPHSTGIYKRKGHKYAHSGKFAPGYSAKIQFTTIPLLSADTPEDATAMLAIELFQQGILKRKGEK